MARVILQQCTEAKHEEGTVGRKYTQIAQICPLEDGSKFENIKAALQTLREAGNYLHQKMHFMGKTIGGKADGDRVQELTGTMSPVID